jgi:hypothetical protein
MRHLIVHAVCAALVVSSLGGCATERKKKFEDALAGGRCEQAYENIPEYDKTLKFVGRVDRAAESTLSYAATGAGYVSDVVLTVVGGAVIMVGLCAPIAALAIATNSSVTVPADQNPCFPMPDGIHPPANGAKIYRATEEMRCPDLTALSRSIRRVADCQTRAGTPDKARITLQSVTSNKDFMGCITSEEAAALKADLYKAGEKIGGSARND